MLCVYRERVFVKDEILKVGIKLQNVLYVGDKLPALTRAPDFEPSIGKLDVLPDLPSPFWPLLLVANPESVPCSVSFINYQHVPKSAAWSPTYPSFYAEQISSLSCVDHGANV